MAVEPGHTHWPETQVPAPHECPQLPQLFGSAERSAQPMAPPHATWLSPHWH